MYLSFILFNVSLLYVMGVGLVCHGLRVDVRGRFWLSVSNFHHHFQGLNSCSWVCIVNVFSLKSSSWPMYPFFPRKWI